MRTIHEPRQILEYLPSTEKLLIRISEAEEAIRRGHTFKVTDHYLKNVLRGNSEHPLLNAILPSLDDLDVEEGAHLSIEGRKFSESEFVVQKYKPNALLTLTTACPQQCTYCFRKQHEDRHIGRNELDKIMHALSKADRNFIELVISGGDPLFASRQQLSHLAERIDSIRQKRPLLVSLNTRMPVVAPELCYRAGDENIATVVSSLEVNNIGLHILHPDEITRQMKDVCYTLRECNPPPAIKTIHPVMKGINYDADILVELYTRLSTELNIYPRDLILPIYTGAGPSKRVSLEEGMSLMRELCERLPGHLLPRLVVCSPMHGKSYVDPFHQKHDGTFGYERNADKSIQGLFIKDGSCMQRGI